MLFMLQTTREKEQFRTERGRKMTFDMQRAREICGRIKGYEDPDGGNFADFQAAEMFPAALDEIERLIHSVDEVVVQLSACRSVAKAIQNEQAARIRELEGAYRLFVESNTKIKIFEKKQTDGILAALDMYEELEKKNIKQHAALKKLGEAKRKRGKALVEERARRICHVCGNDKVGHWQRYEDVVVDEAHEQLRLEGKL